MIVWPFLTFKNVSRLNNKNNPYFPSWIPESQWLVPKRKTLTSTNPKFARVFATSSLSDFFFCSVLLLPWLPIPGVFKWRKNLEWFGWKKSSHYNRESIEIRVESAKKWLPTTTLSWRSLDVLIINSLITCVLDIDLPRFWVQAAVATGVIRTCRRLALGPDVGVISERRNKSSGKGSMPPIKEREFGIYEVGNYFGLKKFTIDFSFEVDQQFWAPLPNSDFPPYMPKSCSLTSWDGSLFIPTSIYLVSNPILGWFFPLTQALWRTLSFANSGKDPKTICLLSVLTKISSKVFVLQLR